MTTPSASSASQAPACPYCSQRAKLVDGCAIYPHRADLAAKRFWQCKPCGAYVGCHEAGNGFGDGTRPLGRLANAELRAAKKRAHWAFDRLWLTAPKRGRARAAAYSWLADALGIPADQCHIGEFDERRCERVVDLVVARMKSKTTAESIGRH
jgi:hypothetical protein